MRAVTAGGVPALVVGETHSDPPSLLYLHGGGYLLGSAFGYRSHAGALATASGTTALVPDYRLAPEHPHPAALEDAVAAPAAPGAAATRVAAGSPAARFTPPVTDRRTTAAPASPCQPRRSSTGPTRSPYTASDASDAPDSRSHRGNSTSHLQPQAASNATGVPIRSSPICDKVCSTLFVRNVSSLG